jgi:hypothetical protein
MRQPLRSPDVTLSRRGGGLEAPGWSRPTDGRYRPREDDVTDPGYPAEVPEADRAEQAPAVPDVGPGGGLPDDAPEADAIEQGMSVVPDAPGPEPQVVDREADDADVLEQETEVPVDDDEPVD